MIGREITSEITLPGEIILILLHEFSLPAEHPGTVFGRTVPELIQTDHLQNLSGYIRGVSVPFR